MRVELCATDTLRLVQRQDLVAKHVITWLHVRDGDGPGVAIGDEFVGRPSAAGEAGFGDFGEEQGRLADGLEVAADGGEVVDDWAGVAVGPGVPL